MLKRSMLLMMMSIGLVACASQRVPQQVEMGKRQFVSGQYAAAFKSLLPAATEGNPDAEYAVGYMYYYGMGTTQDIDTGLVWMQKAADKQQPNAIKALEMLPKSGAVTTSTEVEVTENPSRL